MAERTIIVEQTITSCDICGTEDSVFFYCPICGKTMCSSCRRWNQCIECWNKNEHYAMVNATVHSSHDFENRTDISFKLIYTSPHKLRELYERFAGKNVRITFEEVLSDEAIQKAEQDEQMKSDDPTKWHERCG